MIVLFQDHRGTVKKICTFLGHELEEQTIDLVVEQSSFNMMKSNSMSNNSLVPDYIMDPKNNHFMRKGNILCLIVIIYRFVMKD